MLFVSFPGRFHAPIVPKNHANQEGQKLGGILWAIIVIVLVIYLFGFFLHFGGGLIHLLLIVVVILVIWNLITARKRNP